MTLRAGTRLGPYEVRSAIGAGGMGEVYLARDAKLNRDVALKLLPAPVAHDPDRLARFRREAQVLAALNHPHIAQIYGLDDSSDQPALVMELVTGRTLAELMANGPMPWEEARPIARQIAEALEAAHERGIIHRDLKPANIKVREDGTVKVLDFGLAKALEPTQGTADASPPVLDNSPTLTSPAVVGRGFGAGSTEAGVILGTAAYMAPEQAKGRPIDRRVDIWAFGVVLAEMLIGRSLFAGDSMAETLVAVIKDDPRLDRLPRGTPAHVRRLLGRCLERDPRQRLRDIGEARILLSQPTGDDVPVAPAGPRRRWAAAASAAVVLAALTGIAVWFLRPATTIPLRRFELPAALGDAADLAIAKDGSRLAYILDGHLFVRSFDEVGARDLGRVHPTARQLVWSPDGGRIGFTAEGSIQSIPAEGGQPFVISRIPASGTVMGMTWLQSGRIAFSVWRDSLYTVPASGGEPAVRLAIDDATEIDFHHVSALPDDRLVIATHRRKEDSDIIELVDGERRTVLTTDRGVSWFEYVAPGTLVFRRSATNAGIWAVPFDGGPIDVNGAVLLQAGAAGYRVADDGTLVAVMSAASMAALVWVDRSGAEKPVPGPAVDSPEDDLELAPSGDRAAFVQGRRSDAGGGVGSTPGANIFVRDLQAGVDTRLTLATPDGSMWADAGAPTWFPAGDRLLHRTGNIERFNLVERRADVAGEGRVLTSGFLGRILPDDRTLIYVQDERGAGRLRSATISGNGTIDDRPLFDDAPQPDVRNFDVSSDGRLLAYVVLQPNRRGDIYLTALDDLTARRLVHEGGTRPRFAHDNGQLFFLSGGEDEQGQRRGRLMRVAVKSGSGIAVGPVGEVLRETSGGPLLLTYDVAPDGERFLMWKPMPASPDAGRRVVFVQNALQALRR